MTSDLSEPSPAHQVTRKPKVSELVAAELRRQIAYGRWRAGETLPSEAVLMERFGVSRPTLREAFRILEAESLLNVRRGSNGGPQVCTPDIAVGARYVGVLLQVSGTTIADVLEARLTLEPPAAALLAARRTDQDLRDLGDCVDDFERVLEEGGDGLDAGVWVSLTQRFHDLVLERSGNQTLAVQVGVLWEVVTRHVSVAVHGFASPLRPAEIRQLAGSCRRLISLVEARDAAGAERHWREHMQTEARLLLRDDLAAVTVLEMFG
ncbi:DNA-binding transcriptional regulator, FadR family [Thermomonospora echinospora]|uniref:DNA-binding transcriptional regulator, FadR family n=1 Tax=Thermomonospora echinospora TaxID=1992 RepID=A0A1H6DUY1_9ACTN|nr:FCD domain-containing protein [Thermomonospora echinospora]SEG88516.1 DNA-binding transcriptional regulator, FadR family [Thermomonospora echinospora]